MSDPMDHIERPRPPWRNDHQTECGRDVSEFASVLTRDEAVAKVKKQGQQRAAMSTCMTCWSTAERHGDWANDPAGVIAREPRWSRGPGAERWKTELRALGLLYEAHRDEFDAVMAGLADTSSIADKRAARRYARHLGGDGA